MESLSEILKSDLPIFNEVIPAQHVNENKLRRSPCIYSWFRDDFCLYVGKTINGYNRMFQHKPNFLSDDTIKLFWVPNTIPVECLSKIERHYIFLLKPLLNNHFIPKWKPSIKGKWVYEQTTCDNCGSIYTKRRHSHRFCSTKCRNINYWRNHKVIKIDNEQVVVPDVPTTK